MVALQQVIGHTLRRFGAYARQAAQGFDKFIER